VILSGIYQYIPKLNLKSIFLLNETKTVFCRAAKGVKLCREGVFFVFGKENKPFIIFAKAKMIMPFQALESA